MLVKLVACRYHNPDLANAILTFRILTHFWRLILRFPISYRNHEVVSSFPQIEDARYCGGEYVRLSHGRLGLNSRPRSIAPLEAIGPARLTPASSQSRRPELLHSQTAWHRRVIKGVWRNGSASDSRSEGWEFESLCPHFQLILTTRGTPGAELKSPSILLFSAKMFNLPCISAGAGSPASTGRVAQRVHAYG